MSPLTGHTVIPTGWADHHRPTTQGAMTATITLLDDDGDPTNDAAGWSPTGGKATAALDVTLWSGPARLQPLQSNRVPTADAGGQATGHRQYLVQIPVGAPAVTAAADVAGTRVRVDACPGDPATVGRVLHVVDVAYASQSFTRDLICTDTLADNNPPPTP